MNIKGNLILYNFLFKHFSRKTQGVKDISEKQKKVPKNPHFSLFLKFEDFRTAVSREILGRKVSLSSET